MILSHEFTVPADIEETWLLLTDLERVAPCLPGATLTGKDGEDFSGTVRIKVGPIGANFKGTARFIDRDDARHAAVISMAGKDTNGAATVRADLRAHLEELGSSATRVVLETDLELKGRMAQFGRGAIADVSHRVLSQFTENLGREIAAAETVSASAEVLGGTRSADSANRVRVVPMGSSSADSGELNALSILGPAAVERLAPIALGFAFGYLVARAFPRGA